MWEKIKRRKVERKRGEGGKSLSLLGIGAVSHNSDLGVLNTCLLAWSLTYTDSKQCHGDQLWDFMVIPFAMTLSLHLIGFFRHWTLENSLYNLSFTASQPWSLKSFTVFHLSGSCSQYIPVENSKHQNFLWPPPKTEKWTKSVPLEHSASEITLVQLNRKRRQLKNHQKNYH